jgi:hypothetical protein
MDVHFNAYKAKYDLMDQYVKEIQRAQYVKTMDIFINLDDVLHNMHRPLVNKEVQLCGIHAANQCVANMVNLIAHYKQWASRRQIKCRVFAIYTTTLHHFKNAIYLPQYRDYYATIYDPHNQAHFFVNDAINKALPIAQNICDYVKDVFMVDSRYLEPSMVPWFLKESGVANYEWSMMVSRDHYDLQYAYRDKWIFVSPKGENTRLINRATLWSYLGDREHVVGQHNASFYHHNLFPLALTVAGNKLRSIPRLRRIGWKTIFSYLDEITTQDTQSIQIVSARLLDLLREKGVPTPQIENNLSAVSVDTQVSVMNDIDRSSILDQLKFVTDHDALNTINELYFQQFPINVPFLTSTYINSRPFT